MYSKTCVKWPLSKRPKIGFQDQLLLNAGQKYCRMLQGEHSAILLTCIKLPFVINVFILSGRFTQVVHTVYNMGLNARKTTLLHVNNKSAAQPAPRHSLISPFVIHTFESIITKLAVSKNVTILASLHSSAGWDKLYTLANPEDR